MISPRPYQLEAIAAIRARLAAGDRRTLCGLPTGSGKTFTALMLAESMGATSVLWLAHRDELITQPMTAARQISPSRRLGVVKASRHEPDADYVFASVQTAWRTKRLAALAAKSWDLVVVDEAHHANARTYREILEAVQGPVVGLTATPERSDGSALDEVFDSIAYRMDLLEAIRKAYLVPPSIVTHPIKVDLDKVAMSRGDFAQGALQHELMAAGIVDAVVQAWQAHAQGRKTIIFCVGVEQAQAIAEAVPGCAWVSGKTPTGERRETLQALKDGRVSVIANCAVLTEGFDEPSIDCIIMARPTKSKPLYIQCVGRGLRLYPGKHDCKVVDMVGVTSRHTLMHAPVLFGKVAEEKVASPECDPNPFRDEIMSDDYWRQQYERQIQGLTRERRGHLRWVTVDGGMALAVGTAGTLLATAGEQGWTLVALAEGQRKALANGYIGLELVQGLAEDYVRRAEASGLSNGGQAWRRDTATRKQLDLIAKHKLGEAQTKGEAADLLTAHTATAWYNDPATSKQLYALRKRGVSIPEGATKGWAARCFRSG